MVDNWERMMTDKKRIDWTALLPDYVRSPREQPVTKSFYLDDSDRSGSMHSQTTGARMHVQKLLPIDLSLDEYREIDPATFAIAFNNLTKNDAPLFADHLYMIGHFTDKEVMEELQEAEAANHRAFKDGASL
jgi:hypothetical protein